MMRIITGRARGTKLDTLEGSNTRPTSERAKEAIFSMIQFDVVNTNVLDLFAGSGQMGLEALSRGASRATFVDNSKEAVSIINRNVKKTHFENQSIIVNAAFEQYLKRVIGRETYDLVFLDPPYASGALTKALDCLIRYNLLSENATVVCESDRADVFDGNDQISDKYEIIKQSKYGVACVTIIKPRCAEV